MTYLDDSVGLLPFLRDTHAVIMRAAERLKKAQKALEKAAADFERDEQVIRSSKELLDRLAGKPGLSQPG